MQLLLQGVLRLLKLLITISYLQTCKPYSPALRSKLHPLPITRVYYRKKFKGKERASDEQTVTVMSNLNAPPVFLPLFLNNMYSFPLRSIFTSWMVSASSSLVQQHLFIPWKNTQYTPSACPPRFELLEEENGVINNNMVMTQEDNLSSGSSRDLRTTC